MVPQLISLHACMPMHVRTYVLSLLLVVTCCLTYTCLYLQALSSPYVGGSNGGGGGSKQNQQLHEASVSSSTTTGPTVAHAWLQLPFHLFLPALSGFFDSITLLSMHS